jgi:arsenite methyltransferase
MTSLPDKKQIEQAVRQRYRKVADTAEGMFAYPTGVDGALALGYPPAVVESFSRDLLESFCGVGNPFELGEILPDETVLDLGCGAGFDLLVAAGQVGERGRVLGIDLTPEMVDSARESVSRTSLSNVEIREGGIEELPWPDAHVDVVISNGVLNLSPEKSRALAEVFRVLRPGGRLQFADIVLDTTLPKEVVDSLDAWSG